MQRGKRVDKDESECLKDIDKYEWVNQACFEKNTKPVCPPVSERIIYVIHFAGFSDIYDFDKKYCETRDLSGNYTDRNFVYNLKYELIPSDYHLQLFFSNPNLIQGFSNDCNLMVIYVQPGDDLSHYDRLDAFLTKMESYPIQKTLFNYSKEITLESSYDPKTRILNIISMNDGSLRRLTAGKPGRVMIEDKIFDVMREKDILKLEVSSSIRRLTCAPWLERFLYTAFECGKGRMMQHSGTCYMTSVFNMIFLGKYLKAIFTRAINDFATQNPDTIPLIKQPLETVISCPFFKDDKSMAVYVSKFIYNVACNKYHVSTAQDYFLPGSKEYFYASSIGILEGQGGFSFSVIYRLMMLFKINFKLFNGSLFYEPIEIEHSILRNMSDLSTEMLGLDVAKMKSSVTPDCDCVISTKRNDQLVDVFNFKPEVCIIRLTIETDKESINHVLMGFQCEGIFKVYDSGINLILDCDWYNGGENAMETLTIQLYDFWNTQGNVKFINNLPEIQYIVYVNTSRADHFLKDEKCTF